MFANTLLASAMQCNWKHSLRYCAASRVSRPPRCQARGIPSQENGFQTIPAPLCGEHSL
jgi:hypothetical protein